MGIIRVSARILMSFLFIFSGFVKAIDPLGFAYKFADYFEAFGLHFLIPLALVLAIIIIVAELVIGLNLLFGLRMKTTAWALFAFMVFFTILTFIIALTDPVSDCGCFGDALILTNWETFFKNLIFLPISAFIFVNRFNYTPLFTKKTEWGIVSGLILLGVCITLYNYRNLPAIDFRPYKIGASIPKGMEIPEGAPRDEYKNIMVYEKDGVKKEFTLDSPEQPWSDSTWKWVETQNILVKEGYKPPIHDFTITAQNGDDITKQVLSDDDYSVLIISHDVNRANHEGFKKAKSFLNNLDAKNYKVYVLTSSLSDEIVKIKEELSLEYKFYTTDDITLKTIIRSNPGVVFIKEGHVMGKWHYSNIPAISEIKNKSITTLIYDEFSERLKCKNILLFVGLVLFFLIVLLLTRKKIGSKKDKQETD